MSDSLIGSWLEWAVAKAVGFAVCFPVALGVIGGSHEAGLGGLAAGWGESLTEVAPALARPLPESSETLWSNWIAQEWGGEAEVRTPTGSRVDILMPATAWEVDWCKSGKVYEAVGQALYYRAATNREGGVVLLMGKAPLKQELVWYERCLVACREAGVKLRVVDVRRKQP